MNPKTFTHQAHRHHGGKAGSIRDTLGNTARDYRSASGRRPDAVESYACAASAIEYALQETEGKPEAAAADFLTRMWKERASVATAPSEQGVYDFTCAEPFYLEWVESREGYDPERDYDEATHYPTTDECYLIRCALAQVGRKPTYPEGYPRERVK